MRRYSFFAGGGELYPVGGRLCRGGARDLAHATVPAVSDVYGAVHCDDLGIVLPGSGTGAFPASTPGIRSIGVGLAGAVARGVSQVMFQANIWTALLFLAGIALNDWRHASWVAVGSIVGTLFGHYHSASWAGTVDPESLVNRGLAENVALGLYGYNATLAAVALFLWRRSFIPPLLGMLISVPMTDLVPMMGLPALTAPFVLATWVVLLFGWLDRKLFAGEAATVP